MDGFSCDDPWDFVAPKEDWATTGEERSMAEWGGLDIPMVSAEDFARALMVLFTDEDDSVRPDSTFSA